MTCVADAIAAGVVASGRAVASAHTASDARKSGMIAPLRVCPEVVLDRSTIPPARPQRCRPDSATVRGTLAPHGGSRIAESCRAARPGDGAGPSDRSGRGAPLISASAPPGDTVVPPMLKVSGKLRNDVDRFFQG